VDGNLADIKVAYVFS